MSMGCGEPAAREDLPLLCEDVEPCTSDDECTVVNADPCCALAQIAVLATEVDAVLVRVGACGIENPLCPDCAVRQGSATCVRGRCEVQGGNGDVAGGGR
jgi:hypothetical protein